MFLPANWKSRLEPWWRSRGSYPACRACGQRTGDRWEAKELMHDPATVALMCPSCGHAEVFFWEVLESLLPPPDATTSPGGPAGR